MVFDLVEAGALSLPGADSAMKLSQKLFGSPMLEEAGIVRLDVVKISLQSEFDCFNIVSIFFFFFYKLV